MRKKEALMRAAGHAYNLLSPVEVERIHLSVMRILREVGMQIEHAGLLTLLADFGLEVNFSSQRAFFPSKIVDDFLTIAEKHNWEAAVPRVRGSAGVYHSRYHNPDTLALDPWTETTLADYFALASSLPYIDSALMLGCRVEVPAPLEPLYERYLCWKWGAREGSSIFLDETCPFLYDLYQLRADITGQSVQDVFHGTVYLIPTLRLGRHEAYQVAYFREQGLRVGIGDMIAMGANAPVTLAGAVALNIAEQFALRILDWAWFGKIELRIGGSIAPMDMRTMIYPFGRPEMPIANLMLAQMARFYGASYFGHAGLTDSKLPSVESGYQKAASALPTLLSCGSFWMDAGLLAIDEVCSPIQLILDNEFLSSLTHYIKDFDVTEETIGLDTILETGPGGQYLDKEHTVKNLRSSIWQPHIWSRDMLQAWLASGTRLDVDKAREIALHSNRQRSSTPRLSTDHERSILQVIESARYHLCS